jgi:hypothetical protein
MLAGASRKSTSSHTAVRRNPTCLDERHGRVNNDRIDAIELATRLDRLVAGNDKAMAIVRVPTQAEEQKRARKRQRQQMREQRVSLAAQGRSLMLLRGIRQGNHWWKPACWQSLKPKLAGWLVEQMVAGRTDGDLSRLD